MGDLHRHLDHLRSQAKPFAKFCQDRYNTLIQELENANIQLVESRSAVEELDEKLDRVSKLQEDYSELQATFSNIQLVESRSAVEELEEKLDRVSKLQEDYSELQATFKSTILCLEDEIETLNR
ncbi:Hypothetical protein PHPALM_16898 [Phytophthora palmivora]|uniref:Uncharacterized protein n=1 Tax=Phytophthora palmivora TaxID=4796 RepID=A0A2P4XNS2_9STRA|nr:Hypothetical protein PHPALM_16898 [Phytophthora palmivora]